VDNFNYNCNNFCELSGIWDLRRALTFIIDQIKGIIPLSLFSYIHSYINNYQKIIIFGNINVKATNMSKILTFDHSIL
jgi:hypothetical protein